MARRIPHDVRTGATFLLMAGLASCVAPPRPAPAPPRPVPRPAPALPAAPPQADWRDVPLTPGTWVWRGGQGTSSIAQFGLPGEPAAFALRCDFATRAVVFSRAGAPGAAANAMSFTTSFGVFALGARYGGGQPPAIVAQMGARDPRLDQLAFSRGRFLVDMAGAPRLVLPAWPEVARVIEDCRS